MKLLQFDNGGRPFANDDILGLQTEVFDAAEAALQGAGAMVLSGCKVTVTAPGKGDISGGYIWINGEINRYAGAAQVALPAEVVAGPMVLDDYRAYQTGGSKACRAELSLITQAGGAAAAGTERVLFLGGGATRTYAKWVESQCRQLGDLQEAVNLDSGLYDNTGRGYADLARAGWALANGKNGTADLRGLFRVGYSDAAGDYDAVGKKGGKETVSLTADQNGPHTHTTNAHTFSSSVTYDGGSSGAQAANFNGKQTAKIEQSGNGAPHENRPPYYVTVVWQWVGLN